MATGDALFGKLARFLSSPEPNDKGEYRAFCPVHEDPETSTTPSATINFDLGLWHCNVNCGGGKLSELIKLIANDDREDFDPFGDGATVTNIDEARQKRRGVKVEPINEGKVKGYHEHLKISKEKLRYLREMRGLNDDTIKRFQLGWDSERERYTIPIRDSDGVLVNIRRYKPEAEPSFKMQNALGHGSPARLFPLASLDNDEVIVCEGELDAMLAIQNGLNAITGTHGAGTWRPEWSKQFEGKHVYIIFDCDKEGRIGSKKVARSLSSAASVRIVQLGLLEKEDLTDWFMQGHTAAELRTLMTAATDLSGATPDSPSAGGTEPTSVLVIGSMDSRTNNKPLSMAVTITGKKDPTYSIPHTARLECTLDAGPKCKVCPMNTDWEGEHIVTIEPDNAAAISRFIDAKDEKRLDLLRKEAGIVKCNRLLLDEDSLVNQTVEEIFVTGSLDRSNGHNEADYTQRRVYNVGTHETKTNTTAVVIGTTVPSPKDSRNEFISWHLEEAVTSFDRFKMDKQMYERLKMFMPKEGQTPLEKMREIAHDLSANVTGIMGRERMHMAMDLVWHSALHFTLDGKVISRGWLEFIVVGDTRTGKSETAIRLTDHYGLGHVIGCEGATFAGLVGGVKQVADSWTVSWGEITLNDRRLCVLDEASGLSQDLISQMSDVRSRGMAQLSKIESQQTRARTRLIWISNPRKSKFVDEKKVNGIDILEDLIGNPEDIARFDFAMSVRMDDVPLDKINSPDRMQVPHVYTSELCRDLILWAWSRKPEHIEWKPDAYRQIYVNAQYLGKVYVDHPPLIQGTNVREKIARMAVAMAMRTFSTDETGERVIVTVEHVNDACRFLDQLYKYDNFGYYRISKRHHRNRAIAKKERNNIRKWLSEHPRLLEFLHDRRGSFRSQDVEEMLNLQRDEVNAMLSRLSDAKMISKEKSQIVLEPELQQLLKEMEN